MRVRRQSAGVSLCSMLSALRSMLAPLLVDKHKAIKILGFTFVTERLDRESVVPGRLVDIDSTGLHGRPGAGSEITGLAFGLSTLFTQPAWAGN